MLTRPPTICPTLIISMLCVATALRAQDPTPKPGSGLQGAEVPIGGDFQIRAMPFHIISVSKDQKLTQSPPWHKSGGDWTWLECRTDDKEPVDFGVGMQVKENGGNFAFERAAIAVTDAKAGAKFVGKFASAFKATNPPPKLPQPLKLSVFTSTLLGESMARGKDGGFSGSGNWAAGKWFLPLPGSDEAEVFFNYDLADKLGEFSEKDPDYRDDLAEALSRMLRDGPRPRRTSANDPNIVDNGPEIQGLREIAGARNSFQCFTPDESLAVFASAADESPSTIFAIDPARPQEKIPVVTMEGELSAACLDAGGNRLIVTQRIPKEPHTYSSADVNHSWLVDRRLGKKEELHGPWGPHDSMVAEGISPDHRFIAMDQIKESSHEKSPSYSIIDFYDLSTGKTATAEIPEVNLSLVSWFITNGAVETTLIAGQSWDQGPKPAYHANPATGRLVKLDANIIPNVHAISPDGRLRVEIRPHDRLIVTDVAGGASRQFVFHEDDRRLVVDGCVEWLGSRYLSFHNGELMLIDVDRMKMSRVLSNEFQDRSADFSAKLKWAVVHGEKSDWIGAVVLPSAKH